LAGALVALKVVRDRNKDQYDLDHTFRRFLQEYEIVQRIKHPSVVQLYDLGVSDDHAWLVMEYFKEGDDIPSKLCPLHEGTFKQETQRVVQGVLSGIGRAIRGIFK